MEQENIRTKNCEMKLLNTRNITGDYPGQVGQQLTYELNRDDYIFYGEPHIAIHKKLCDKNHFNYWYYKASYSQHFKHEGKELFNAIHLRYNGKWGLTSDNGNDIIVVWKD